MESEKGPVATDAPPFSPPGSHHAEPQAHTSVESLAVEAAARATQSLKRQREATPTSPESDLNARLDPALSPTKSARILNVTVRHSPAPLTGAAAVEDERRRQEDQFRLQVTGASDNPAYRAQAALLSAESLAMSRPQDAPAAETHHEENHHADSQQEMQVEHTSEQHGEHHAEQPAEHHVEHHVEAATEHIVDPQMVPLPETQGQDDAEVSHDAASIQNHVPEPSMIAPMTATEPDVHTKRDPATDAPASIPLPAEPVVPVTESPAPMDVDARNGSQGFAPPPPMTTAEDKGGMSMSYPGLLPPVESMPAPPARGMTLPITPSHAAAPRSPNSKKHKCPYCETEFTRHHNLKSHLLTHSQEKPYVCQTCQMRFRRLHDLKRHSKLHTGEKPHICPKCDRKFARGDALARHSKGPGGCVGRRSSMGGSFLDDDMEDTSQLEGDSVMTDVVYDGANDESMTDEDRQRLGMQNRNNSHTQGSDKSAETHNTYSAGPSDSVLEALKSSISNLAANATAESHNASADNYSAHQSYAREPSERHSSPGFSAADAARYAASAAAGATASVANAIAAHGLPNQQDLSTSSQNGASGDSASNNMFATDQGFWTYIHALEEQVRQVNDRLSAMEATERSQEERINYLTTEVESLRHQLDARPAVETDKLD